MQTQRSNPRGPAAVIDQTAPRFVAVLVGGYQPGDRFTLDDDQSEALVYETETDAMARAPEPYVYECALLEPGPAGVRFQVIRCVRPDGPEVYDVETHQRTTARLAIAPPADLDDAATVEMIRTLAAALDKASWNIDSAARAVREAKAANNAEALAEAQGKLKEAIRVGRAIIRSYAED